MPILGIIRDASTGCAHLTLASAGTHRPIEERVMSEFLRSGAIMLMGLTVMAAGVAVIFLA